MNNQYGKYHETDAIFRGNSKNPTEPFRNGITRRPKELTETLPSRRLSSSLASANIKSLRLYRNICRLIPYIIKIHQINFRTTSQQAKIYVGNHFRAQAHVTNLVEIDRLVDNGYQELNQAEWHHSQTGYLYKYILHPQGHYRDLGIDRFDDYRAQKNNRKQKTSSFLKGFYNGYKSHEL